MATPDVNLRTGMLNGLTSLIAKINAEQYVKTYYVDNLNGSDTANNGLSWQNHLPQSQRRSPYGKPSAWRKRMSMAKVPFVYVELERLMPH